MVGKYKTNPVYKLYLNFSREMDLINIYKEPGKEVSGFDEYEPCCYEKLDGVLRLILLNNGCKISDDYAPLQSIHEIIEDEYRVCFITNMLGNDTHEYYDFVIFNDMKYLIIFTDYFNNIIKESDLNEDDPLYAFKLTMGNSVYYDAIKKIVEIFYLTSEPMPGGLLTTSMATTQRWNQAIIAINILNKFKPVDGNDVSDIPMADIENILEGNIEAKLYGIRAV